MVRPPSGQLSLAHHVLFLDSISALWFHLQGRWSFRQPCQMTYWDLRDTELTPLPAFCGLLLPPASFSTSGNLEFSHPSWSATVEREDQYAEKIRISIHAPREGCDVGIAVCGVIGFKFQSTHPSRGATCPLGPLHRALDISIHAPLTGCDRARQRTARRSGDFNPRTP